MGFISVRTSGQRTAKQPIRSRCPAALACMAHTTEPQLLVLPLARQRHSRQPGVRQRALTAMLWPAQEPSSLDCATTLTINTFAQVTRSLIILHFVSERLTDTSEQIMLHRKRETSGFWSKKWLLSIPKPRQESTLSM